VYLVANGRLLAVPFLYQMILMFTTLVWHIIPRQCVNSYQISQSNIWTSVNRKELVLLVTRFARMRSAQPSHKILSFGCALRNITQTYITCRVKEESLKIKTYTHARPNTIVVSYPMFFIRFEERTERVWLCPGAAGFLRF
jgi:hypothetical protein